MAPVAYKSNENAQTARAFNRGETFSIKQRETEREREREREKEKGKGKSAHVLLATRSNPSNALLGRSETGLFT
jgi:hypothetical protein